MVIRFEKPRPVLALRRSEQMLELFLAKRENAGLTAVTLKSYRRTISSFLESPGVPANPAKWTDAHVDFWLNGLRLKAPIEGGRRRKSRDGSMSPASLAHELRNLFVFLGWLYDRDEIAKDIRKRVERVRVPKSRGRVATGEIVDALLVAASLGRKPYRNTAILRVLQSTGIRRSELAHLDLCHVDLRAAELRLPAEMTKAKSEARVPFDSATKAALWEYIAEERGESPGPLFLGHRGRLQSHGMAAMIAELSRRAEVEVSSHDFRRGFAVSALADGMEVTQVARILRHETLAMTLLYAEEGRDDNAIAAYRARSG